MEFWWKFLKAKIIQQEVEPEDRWRRIFPGHLCSVSINIVLTNVSLSYIPVSFMQIIKSFTPATTGWSLCCSGWFGENIFDWRIWTSLVSIVGGICSPLLQSLVLTFTDFVPSYLVAWLHLQSLSLLSLCCMDICLTVLSSKTIKFYDKESYKVIAQLGLYDSQDGHHKYCVLHGPFATMIMGVPAIVLEGIGVMNWFHNHSSVFSSLIIIFNFGLLAFCLNFSIFYVIHSTTAVTFNVAGNLKVAVAILASRSIFRNPISAMNAVGCGVTLIGCMFFVYVRQKLSKKPSAPPQLELLPLVNDEPDDKL
ncbi:hypothetical protein HYC85_001995 [Camellia sinensis]|uniref:Sugar phosphate transporter domain-containing protein n=1 Tax=Camellia sinensis TaxID=4442 RepID=A0A7J7I8A3_CAMSI|nr:hypothetical protein HYC85_001995 [Camellia sinensis]